MFPLFSSISNGSSPFWSLFFCQFDKVLELVHSFRVRASVNKTFKCYIWMFLVKDHVLSRMIIFFFTSHCVRWGSSLPFFLKKMFLDIFQQQIIIMPLDKTLNKLQKLATVKWKLQLCYVSFRLKWKLLLWVITT